MRHPDRPVRRPLHTKHRRLTLLVWAAWAGCGGVAGAQGDGSPAPATAAGGTQLAAPEEPLALEAVRPGPAREVAPENVPKSDNLPDLTAVSTWAIPPVRWGGNTSSSYNWNDNSSGSRSFNATQSLNLRAASYIYQPWYAQVSGDVGLLSGSARAGGADSAAGTSRNSALTYGGNLNLFPQSRFPFQAYIQTSDSRANANATGSQYTATRLGARQSYRPEVGPQTYALNADRSVVTSGAIRSVVDALQGNYATTLGDHNLSANARYSRNSGDLAGQGSNLLSVNGSHSWRADEEFSVASSANVTSNQIRLLTNSGLTQNSSQIVQAGSSVTWLPDEDLPLTIVGGGSFLHLNTVTELASTALTNLSGYANANYRFSDNLSGTAGVTLLQNVSNTSRQFASSQSASLSYSGTPLIFGEYSYNWGTGGGISNQWTSGGAGNRSLSGQLQHGVMRSLTLGEASELTMNAGQSFSLASNSTSGQSGVLSHSGGALWRLSIGERSQGMLSATLSDNLSSGAYASHYRSLSSQGNVQTQLSSRSALTANLNFVLSQQLSSPQVQQTEIATPTVPAPAPISNTGSSTMNGSGQVSYTHRSPFDVSNLVYGATVQWNGSQSNLRVVSGDPNGLAWQTSKVFQQNLDYRLGRLVFRATSSFATMNGKKNASLFLVISREIGDF